MIADDSVLMGHFFGGSQRRATFHREVGEWAVKAWRDACACADGGVPIEEFLSSLPQDST